METIRLYIEKLLEFLGASSSSVPLLRHLFLITASLLLAAAAYYFCRGVLLPFIQKVTEKTSMTWDDIILNKRVLVAACRIVPAIVVWWLLPLAFYQFPTVRDIIARLTALYITFMSVKLLLALLDSFSNFDISGHSSTQQYINTLQGILRVIIIFFAAIVVVAIIINRNPTTLIAGLGATSAILMLVFKDTITGLVAGVRLTSNDMLHKGDWITVPNAGADGTVENISLTTVKIRNWDNTIITVTPQKLVDESFQNWIGMQKSAGRRVTRRVYLDFHSIHKLGETTNLTEYRLWAEQFIKGRPEVNGDMLCMVRELQGTPTGLPVEFYFFLYEKDWKKYEYQLSAIMDRLYAAASDYGLKIYQQLSSFD